MEFVRRIGSDTSRLGVLPGTFNPITVAHLALARAAQSCCQEIVFVLPRVFPHKGYTGASFAERLELLDLALRAEGQFSLAIADQGLFVNIAAECRQAYGPEVRLTFLCGRDAAERIAGWDYGNRVEFPMMLQAFDLLVAARNGEYTPPAGLSDRIERLELPRSFSHVSSTEVRERVARGYGWEHLVPTAVHQRVREIYGTETFTDRRART